MPLKIAILVSGRGSNMSAIIEAIKMGQLDAGVELVFSNNPEAPALAAAQAAGVQTIAISHKRLSREQHEEKLLDVLSPYEVDLLVLAGYMRLFSPSFLSCFRTEQNYFRIVNIHPSLLPAFPGMTAYEDAFNYGVRLSGVTVHLVDEQVDHGPILAQETFPRLQDDTLESFKARGLELEHRLYPQVLQSIAENGIRLLPKPDRFTGEPPLGSRPQSEVQT